MKRIICFILFSHAAVVLGQRVSLTANKATLSNSSTELIFDLNKGTYEVRSTPNTTPEIIDAVFYMEGWRSDAKGNRFSARQFAVSEFGHSGKALEITCSNPRYGIMRWTARAYTGKSFMAIGMSFVNRSGDTIQLKEWGPLANGRLYDGVNINNGKMLDGNGGGEATRVYDAGFLKCRNNLLFTFDNEHKNRKSFVMGGIRYADFEKHTLIETDQVRRNTIRSIDSAAGLKMISYLDLGEDSWEFNDEGTGLIVLRAWPHPFHSAKVKELGSTVYGSKKIIIGAKKLNPAKSYSIGLSWMDEADGRVQTVYADNGEGTSKTILVPDRTLPQTSNGSEPEETVVEIPKQITAKGEFRIVVEAVAGPNAVLSEIWLNEGVAANPNIWKKVSYSPPRWFKAAMYAKDPVGKRIDPDKSYSPVNDLFYFDIATPNPFLSLENYAAVLKQFQQVNNLSLYTFPSVCLWYASHRNYGGGPSVNDSPGAVKEMDRADSSGFTKYSKVAIRLVPDNYEINNEQGWWDDKHWQMYGSGSDNPNSVIVPGAHYKAPYETTKKWASAILQKGGIPLTYVQTARRSQDFCDSFPQYMLFNESNHRIPDSNWLTLGKASYDFTDPGFITHMKRVYQNLRNGGVKGMMFDYTSTAWADFGGMEDRYSTAAAMYRNVFKLAHEGLGPGNWIHERNLERGTDLTLGLVASQRVWGDTDGITDEMVSRTGLRWYKNRLVVSYDMDSKNTEKLRLKNRDLLRQMLTMAYVASGRLLLGNSFAKMNAEDIHDLSRVFPFHSTPQSARPVDAFIKRWPTVYDFKVNNSWHLVTLYNTSDEKPATFNIPLSEADFRGGLDLNAQKEYYFYDFWNRHFIGVIKGNETLTQELRPSEARMIAVHERKDHPQFISTDRHLMQGYIDLKNITWNAIQKRYSGTAGVIKGEPFTIILAANGMTPRSCSASGGKCSWRFIDTERGLIEIKIETEITRDIEWSITFK